MKSKILICLSIFTVLLTVGCGCTTKKNNNDDNGIEKNEPTPENPVDITNEEMIKDQNVESLSFKNTALVYDGNMTKLTSEVTNSSDQVVNLTGVTAYITYIDVNNNEVVLEMEVYFGETLKPGETRSTENFIDVDLRTSSKIEYKIKA